MGADSLSQFCTWVDAAYGVHPDLKIHTGGCMYFVNRVVHSKSSKQKINTNISTKDQVVGESYYLPYKICIFLFMGAQWYDIKQENLFQDNQSAIKMKKNGNKSCTGNSRHIDICYFFAKDRFESKKMSISYCSTERMLAYFLLKPYKETYSQNSVKWQWGRNT